jgi:hypothetical protein
MKRSRRLLGVSVVAAGLAAWPGCASLPFQMPFAAEGEVARISEEELSREIENYASRFSALVSTAGEEISLAAGSPTIRRRSLLWGMRINPAVQEAALRPNPRAGYVRALTVSVMMRRYLTTGDGRDLFGTSQPIAVAVAETLEADALAIGGMFLMPAELERARRDVDQIAERFPIQGTQFSMVHSRKAAEAVRGSSVLNDVITLPLAPFRALQSVDVGAAAVRDFNQTARRFSNIVAQLPEVLRGEMRLLLFDAEELGTVQQGLMAFEQAAASAERASLALEQAPAALRATLDQEARALLEQSQGTIEQASRALAQARELALPLQETARELREASASWHEILGPHDPTPRGPDERSFDIREWEAAARAIGTSAVELRALAAELRGLSGAGGLDGLLWRAAALLALFFALLLAYRVVAARAARRS